MIRKLVLGFAAAGLLAGAAAAADLPVKARPMAVESWNWTGFYGGVHAGFAGGVFRDGDTITCPTATCTPARSAINDINQFFGADSLRKSGFEKETDHSKIGQRSCFGWFDNHRVSRQKCRPDLVAHQRHLKIPRHDRADYTERSSNDQPFLTGIDLRNVTATNVFAQPRVVLDGVGESADLQDCLADRFPLLFCKDGRKFLLVHSKQLDRPAQHVGSPGLRPLAPNKKRRVRDVDRLASVFRSSARRRVYGLAGSRIEYFDEVAVSRVNPLAAN